MLNSPYAPAPAAMLYGVAVLAGTRSTAGSVSGSGLGSLLGAATASGSAVVLAGAVFPWGADTSVLALKALAPNVDVLFESSSRCLSLRMLRSPTSIGLLAIAR